MHEFFHTGESGVSPTRGNLIQKPRDFLQEGIPVVFGVENHPICRDARLDLCKPKVDVRFISRILNRVPAQLILMEVNVSVMLFGVLIILALEHKPASQFDAIRSLYFNIFVANVSFHWIVVLGWILVSMLNRLSRHIKQCTEVQLHFHIPTDTVRGVIGGRGSKW